MESKSRIIYPFDTFCFCGGITHEINCLRESLYCLPPDTLKWCSENVVYFSTCAFKTGSRLSRGVCETKEIIILSDKIFPLTFTPSDKSTRFFIFIVFHETAHAILKHQCTRFDKITGESKALQEQEADALALEWFEFYAKHNGLPILKKAEIDEYERIINQHIEVSAQIQKKCLAKRLKQIERL